METLPDIDVFVGNNTYFDFNVLWLWLQQLAIEEATNQFIKVKGLSKNIYLKNQVTFYILDQYRTFGMIEPMLFSPKVLSNQLNYQVSDESLSKLIAKYYQFDEIMIRDLLGKKLSKSTRRDLDEISAKSGIRLKSCQRQFDNCRRVYKTIEDLPGQLVENIQLNFLLPFDLAWNYAAIVFLSSQRFECSKRKLATLSLNDFVQCSKFLVQSWTNSSGAGTNNSDLEIDRDVLHELRGVKLLISDQKLYDRHKQTTFQEIAKNTQKGPVWCDVIFRQVSRGMVGIACNLYRTKEMRDYFLDLLERVVEPCLSAGLERTQLELFLSSYFKTTKNFSQMLPFITSWTKYFKTTKCCILQMYRL